MRENNYREPEVSYNSTDESPTRKNYIEEYAKITG